MDYGERFLVTVEWSEDIRTGAPFFSDIKRDFENVHLFSTQSTVEYAYDYIDNYFYSPPFYERHRRGYETRSVAFALFY